MVIISEKDEPTVAKCECCGEPVFIDESFKCPHCGEVIT